MDSNTLFPTLSSATPDVQNVHGAVGLSASSSQDQQYAALPSSQEMKDLLSGLSQSQSGKSDQFPTSGVDYWKNSQQVHDIMQNLLKVSAGVKQEPETVAQTSSDAGSAAGITENQAAVSQPSEVSSTALNSTIPVVAFDALVIDNPIYDQGGIGGDTWYFTGNPFNYNNIDAVHGFSPSGSVRNYLSENGYTWANNDASFTDGAVPNIPQPGYSNSTTNKYLLQDWDQTSSNAISTKLLGHVFTPQTNSDWISVITQDVKENGWLIPRVWLQIYETVSHYPEVQSDLNTFQAQILDRTSANFDMQWTNWAQDTMAHGYSLDQMRSNLAHSDATTAALKQALQDIQGRVPTDNDMTWIQSQEDTMGNGSETLDQVYQGLALWTGEHGGYDGMITDVLGRAAGDSDEPWRQWVEQTIGNHTETYASVRVNLASSQAEQAALSQLTLDVQGRALGTTDSDNQWLSYNEDRIGNGTITYAGLRNETAHWSGERDNLSQLDLDVQGHALGTDDSSNQWLSYNEDRIGNGTITYAGLRNETAHWSGERDNLSQLDLDVQGHALGTDDSSNQWLSYNEDRIGNGTITYAGLRNETAHWSGERDNLSQLDLDVQGHALGTDDSSNQWLSYNEDRIGNGTITYAGLRNETAHWSGERGNLSQLDLDVQGHALGTDDSSNQWLSYNEDRIGNGTITYAGLRNETAHWSGERDNLGSGLQFMVGRSVNDADSSWISISEDAIGSGTYSYQTVVLALSQTSEFISEIGDVYADWGQLPPTDDQLKTAGQAMFNLHAAWIITKDQTIEQLQAEANGYQALSANGSFQDYIDNVAGSAEQARDLEASMLADPLMEEADNVQDARNLLTQGGGSVEGAMVDQGVMRTVIQQDKENPLTPCNDVATFRKDHTKVVYNNPQITSANAQWQTVNQRDWSTSYVANGVVWNEAKGGAGASAQGLPYEAYVQEKLNGGNPTGDYVWLQDHRSNWMTFDHWNEGTGDAVSDKALNTNRDMYKTDPANIKYRIWADMKEMAMKYTEGRSRQGTTQPVRFTQEDIQTYTFELGVRTATTTDAQWKQICEAYRGAGAKMASYERNGYKPLDFEIDAISDAVS
ncbi:endonuclease toxin domain-containing protein [Gluconobacter oxydans]|uniref:endonuclease toxin domain-containing protein n=1 Tax=Gluconobacter oxydans TaxID=442 RepID=UPI0015596629|nr:hypothetical protein [Gluconobacter oxydans]